MDIHLLVSYCLVGHLLMTMIFMVDTNTRIKQYQYHVGIYSNRNICIKFIKCLNFTVLSETTVHSMLGWLNA